jgi:adenylate kinase family enzyme
MSNGGITVMMFIGIPGSGKTTLALLLQNILTSKFGYSQNDVEYLDQDMFNGNSKNYNNSIKNAIKKENLKVSEFFLN